MSVRHGLDLHEINRRLQKEETYSSIAERMKKLTGLNVTRSVIAGIDRDIKNGKIAPFSAQPKQMVKGLKPKTYVYGQEQDNGGIPLYTGNLTVDLSHTMIISDTHLPYADYSKLEKLPVIAAKFGIRDLIIVGDWLNGDSRHHKRRTKTATLSEQAAVSRDVFEYLNDHFGRFYYLGGNHDNWFAYDTNGELDFPDIARLSIPPDMAGKVVVSPYDHMTLNSGGVRWELFHQDDYSKNPLMVARDLALKYQSNVICAHMHMTAWGYDMYGRYKTVAIGGLLDPKMLEYTRLRSSRAPEMTAGIAVILDGEETIITDFDRY